MPSLTDIVKTTFVQELSGVQMANHIFWRIDDLGTNPANTVALGQIMTGYYDAVKATLAPAWSLVCAIMENLSAIEAKSIVFDSLPGTGLVDAHPQDQVVRLNRYSVAVPPANGTLRVAGFNQSGVVESLSTRGRVNDTAEFLPIRNFLRTQQIFATEWTVTPMMRMVETPGNPPIYQFQPVQQCLLQPTFLKLRGRKTSLCAA